MRRLSLLLPVFVFTLLLATACGGSDDGDDVASTGDSSTSTAEESSSTTAATEAEVDTIWPPADEAPVDDPAAVAVDFAERYLGITGAAAGEPVLTEEPQTATVPVTKGADGATTTVLLGFTGEGWYVTSASAESILVDSPTPQSEVVSPLALAGQANAFEGTVVVQVRAAGSTEALGEGFVTGAMGELGAFTGEITFAGATPGEVGAVVFYAPDESGEGTAITATVVPVRFTA